MNRNFIFALILLVTLFSIVNASPLQLNKRATQFNKCEGYPKGSEPELLTVKLTPDPIGPGEQTFEVSITMQNYDITPGTVLNIDVIDQVNPKLLVFYSIDICSQTDCPIKAGTKYSSTQKFTLPKVPSKYFIRAEHFMNAPDVTIPFSCGIAIIGS